MHCRVVALFCFFALLLAAVPAQAGNPLPLESPIGFFTNVASRLLQSQLKLDLGRIQIYPTNQYTPAVHRLLQVAANVYDCTTNRGNREPYFPSVFRPIFLAENDRVFIVGYSEVENAGVFSAPMRDLTDPQDRALLKSTDLVYGIPLVIGARKGFPNFNELSAQTDITVSRKLEFRRSTSSGPVTETNQMYVVGISNVAGIEAWNSYTNVFKRSLQLFVAADFTGILSNESGQLISNRYSAAASMGLITNWGASPSTSAFLIPLVTTNAFLPLSTYHQDPPGFLPFADQFERGGGFPVPNWRWRLNIRLRFALVDFKSQRIVDYVNVMGTEQEIDVTAKLMEDGSCDGASGSAGSQWCTNRVQNSSSPNIPTYGILNQINVCLGAITPDDWYSFNANFSGNDRTAAIAQFRYQLLRIGTPGYPGPYYTSNVFEAPFEPFRRIYQHVQWQANDPLVHYLASDLRDPKRTNNINFIWSNPWLPNLARINDRYEPWNFSGQGHSRSPTLRDATVKDPLITRSDSWDFPENQPLNGAWLGRVHRGTPWQSLYLKSDPPNPTVWGPWVGTTNQSEALAMQPTTDWGVVAQLNLLFNPSNLPSLLSVNEPNLAAWQATLDGINVLSNSVSDADWSLNPFRSAQFDSLVMVSNSPQAAAVAAAIVLNRDQQPAHYFETAADLLATRELSFASPWLNVSEIQLRYAINDEAYERIPAQLLMRVRPDSIGTLARNGDLLTITFSGLDEHAYRIESSFNLVTWETVSTTVPTNGVMILTQPIQAMPRFYRSVLVH